MSDLAVTQRWMLDVITDPDGLDAGLAHAADGSRRTLEVDAVVHGSQRLGARERLALYSRAYHRRLADCLRESYPGLRHALGHELFDDFAQEYLRAQPSRSYTLASLGARWPAHLEATRPDRDREPDARESWPDFLIDLARMERTFCEVYNAPGVEGVRLPSAADVPIELDPGVDWHAVTATPVVCLRLLFARFPVGAYLIAVRRGDAPQLPAAQQTYLALSRRDYVVTITELDGGGHALLSELADGASVGAAAHDIGLTLPASWQLIRNWADRGLIAAIEYPPARRVV